jgi:acetylornithine deacetylase
VRRRTVPGLPSATFAFTADVPQLDRWGEPLLFGPDALLVAHTAHERVVVADLQQACDACERLIRNCPGAG